MSKADAIKTLIMFAAIVLGVAGVLYSQVNLGMTQQDLSAWLESATGTIALAAAVLWVAVIWVFVYRRTVG